MKGVMKPSNAKLPEEDMNAMASRTLQLHNTLTGRQESFVPRKGHTVKLFTCGPSIYGAPHIGNYRTFLYEDILHRYLEYLGYKVDRLINFTDVEDKTIAEAGKSMAKLRAVTEDAAENFFKNTGLLHLRMPDFIPRSSTCIDQAVQLIQELLDKKMAYRFGGDIFYDPLKFKGFGKLYGLDMNKWPTTKRRYRKDTYRGNRWNRGDFILWHAYRQERDGDIFWETKLGKGRPAWNVQDPAMITQHFGFEIDISCGGIDNLYRHHDYNIAVIEAVSGTKFAHFWLHGEHVLLNGKKMSKSRGNIIYPQDLLDRGMRAAAIRYFLMSNHYRRKLNLTDSLLHEKEGKWRKLQSLALQFNEPLQGTGDPNPSAESDIKGLSQDFEETMNDDLHVNRACDALCSRLEKLALIHQEEGLGKEQGRTIRKGLLLIDTVLQILFE